MADSVNNTPGNTPGSSNPSPAKLAPEAVIAQLRTIRSQIGEVEPARQVLCRFDDGQHAALALLLDLEPVADGQRHAGGLDQGRAARVTLGQRFDLAEPAREFVGRCAPVRHDQGKAAGAGFRRNHAKGFRLAPVNQRIRARDQDRQLIPVGYPHEDAVVPDLVRKPLGEIAVDY